MCQWLPPKTHPRLFYRLHSPSWDRVESSFASSWLHYMGWRIHALELPQHLSYFLGLLLDTCLLNQIMILGVSDETLVSLCEIYTNFPCPMIASTGDRITPVNQWINMTQASINHFASYIICSEVRTVSYFRTTKFIITLSTVDFKFAKRRKNKIKFVQATTIFNHYSIINRINFWTIFYE